MKNWLLVFLLRGAPWTQMSGWMIKSKRKEVHLKGYGVLVWTYCVMQLLKSSCERYWFPSRSTLLNSSYRYKRQTHGLQKKVRIFLRCGVASLFQINSNLKRATFASNYHWLNRIKNERWCQRKTLKNQPMSYQSAAGVILLCICTFRDDPPHYY